jgi:hypothetical protein
MIALSAASHVIAQDPAIAYRAPNFAALTDI